MRSGEFGMVLDVVLFMSPGMKLDAE
jgi:hypothetical protein